MQLSDVVLIYFVIGAVMVGGGAVDIGQAGIVGFFVEQDDTTGEIEATGNATNQIDKTDNAITTVVSLAVGAAVLVWNLALGLFAFIHWPIVTLTQNNAPPMAVLLLGGSFTAAFYMAVIGTVWRSA
jgi:hypothetical protein